MVDALSPIERRRSNPFDDDLARANSSYAAYQDDRLVCPPDAGGAPSPLAEFVHDQFRALVASPRFSCVGAKAAVNSGRYRFGLYEELAAPAATAGLAHDLFLFIQEQDAWEADFSSFVAAFAGPTPRTEEEFERLLWAQLQALHERDRAHHAWDPSVSDDPTDPRFSFSFGGRAFFVVGLHAASARWARRFAWPILVFNAHRQFERLRADGRFARIQEAIRARETLLQGGLNTNLSNYGELPEARQYAGRPVELDWRCPFQPSLVGRSPQGDPQAGTSREGAWAGQGEGGD